MGEEVGLITPVDMAHVLDHPVCRGSSRHHFHLHRVMQKAIGNLENRSRHRGRKEKRLATRRQPGHDPLDIRGKPHVQHSISLIQNKHPHPAHIDATLLGKIEEATRRGHNDIHTFAQGADLRILAHPTKDHCMPERQILTVVGKKLSPICAASSRVGVSTSTCGRRDTLAGGCSLKRCKNWQSKRGRFARARLCAPQKIAPIEQMWNRLGLNGGKALRNFCPPERGEGARQDPVSKKEESFAYLSIMVTGPH